MKGRSMSSHAPDIKKEVRTYILVFVGLLALTIVTVAVSYLHLNIKGAVILALIIATIKASMVACYFMHLISEKKLIYIILIFTFIFFLSLISIKLTEIDDIIGTTYVS